MSGRLLHSQRQTAELLGVSEKTVRRLVGRGEIKTVRVGRRVFITADEVRDFITRNESGRPHGGRE